jgi:hypothetical protein
MFERGLVVEDVTRWLEPCGTTVSDGDGGIAGRGVDVVEDAPVVGLDGRLVVGGDLGQDVAGFVDDTALPQRGGEDLLDRRQPGRAFGRGQQWWAQPARRGEKADGPEFSPADDATKGSRVPAALPASSARAWRRAGPDDHALPPDASRADGSGRASR